ncbi:antibiotic biosynthesis monooxygenase family protein [Oceanobacillus sp. FSL K6-0118]|uniref:antibiotic biosynthesis monooxygenase family protein n=2 Tax=Bacillales TaxID=1385 RepID=UPI0030FB1D78
MKAHMTNGTLDFLLKLEEKHPNISFHFMTSNSGALAYYENSDKKVFSAGRTYEIVKQSGNFIKKAYIVMNTITVYEEDQNVFEDRIKNRLVNKIDDCHAYRFLKPVKGNKFVILTVWKSVENYNNWKKSQRFQDAQKILHAETPAYPSDLPFTTSYFLYEKEGAN